MDVHYKPSSWRCYLAALGGVALACGAPQQPPATQPQPPALKSAPASNAGTSEATAAPAIPEPPAFFRELVEKVRSASPESLRAPRATLPEALAQHDGSAPAVHFRPERSVWRDEPGKFEVQFVHPSVSFLELIEVNVIDGRTRPLPFSPQLFDYGSVPRPESGAGLGFSGFRIHTALNRDDYLDELIVFEGASYFRSLAQGQTYGSSARGLAVDMGASTPEEFPGFREFYLQRPAAEDDALWMFATLASERTRGAYAFHAHPGSPTVVDVLAHVWVDRPVESLGLAPLSSMFLFGEEGPAAFGDYRPEVHDADGMAFNAKSGEWLWRPLQNPRRTQRSTFRLDSPKGFGLIQRDRDFEHYQDLDARYQDRPSIWIEPLDDWGTGELHLLEISTLLESDDNVALAWVPDDIPEDGLALRYRLHFGEVPATVPGCQVAATRLGQLPTGTRFVVDFEGASCTQLPPGKTLSAHVDATGGLVTEAPKVSSLPNGQTRVTFHVTRAREATSVELRAYLYRDQDVLSETWSYRWQPSP